MGKKNAFVTTIGFNKNDPAHVQVAEFLNGMERGKAQYIVNAVLAYQGCQVQGDVQATSGMAFDYDRIRAFVLQVIEEHEGQKKQRQGSADAVPIRSSPPESIVQAEPDAVMGMDEETLSGIMLSLEAFKG